MLFKTLIVTAFVNAQTIKNNSSFVHDLKLIETVNDQAGFQIDVFRSASDWLIFKRLRFDLLRHNINLKTLLSVF